jgi:hypothetical protein
MALKSIQSAFFPNLTDPQAFRLMFDQQPNVFIFVKDRASHLIAASLRWGRYIESHEWRSSD